MILGLLEVVPDGTMVVLSTGQAFRIFDKDACKVCRWQAAQCVCIKRLEKDTFELLNLETHETVGGIAA